MTTRVQILGILMAVVLCASAAALDTAFSYQGRLMDAGSPANDDYDFQFILYDAVIGGSQVGPISYVDDTAVADGFFTAHLDFGTGVFAGTDLWLEVSVRDGSSTGSYTPLAPRQPLTAAPHSLFALTTPAGWTASGPDIYTTNAGNVGIGTPAPEKKLHVHGGARFSTGDIEISGGNVRLWAGDKAMTLRQDSNDSFISNKADFVGSGSGSNGRLILNGEGGVHLTYGADGSSGTDGLAVAPDGLVGIGTTDPQGDLHVKGTVWVDGYWPTSAGMIRVMGPSLSNLVRLSHVNGETTLGLIGVGTGGWPAIAKMYVNTSGEGVVAADVKNFVSPNPIDPREDIWYACVEGPEAAMYVRGTGRLVDGRATIELPDHFRDLAAEDGLTVQLTPRNFDSLGLGAVVRGLDLIEVGELHGGRGNYEFDWEVKAVRRAHQDYQVTRPWTHALAATDQSLDDLWTERLKSIERRELRIQEMEARLAEEREGAND